MDLFIIFTASFTKKNKFLKQYTKNQLIKQLVFVLKKIKY